MKIRKNMNLSFSILVTGRCDLNCPYCHFYANHDRDAYNRDISDELFDKYIEFIHDLQKVNKKITVRFSGGEPLVLGERLFELANRLYTKTGISPFIMTNGKCLSNNLINYAKDSHISSFVVSMDNPFRDNYSKKNCEIVLNKFKELKNADVPLFSGMVVLNNTDFKDLVKIADYFYEQLGVLPPMTETNFAPFEIPTDEQLHDLHNGVKEIVKKYNGKTDLLLFPFITPEYYANNLDDDEFLTEFPMDDKFDFLSENSSFSDKFHSIEAQLDVSYRKFDCGKYNCDWYGSCDTLKWVWFSDKGKCSAEQKIKEYCRYKKAIASAFYEALIVE